jgi:hypothetical protein
MDLVQKASKLPDVPKNMILDGLPYDILRDISNTYEAYRDMITDYLNHVYKLVKINLTQEQVKSIEKHELVERVYKR